MRPARALGGFMRNWQELLGTRLRTFVIRYAPVVIGLPVKWLLVGSFDSTRACPWRGEETHPGNTHIRR